jgi:hypothetical protein
MWNRLGLEGDDKYSSSMTKRNSLNFAYKSAGQSGFDCRKEQ